MNYDRRILYSNIDDKLTEFGVDFSWLPLDVEDLAQSANIEIKYHSFESISIGAVLYKDYHSAILVNKRKPLHDQRFDIAHELIHYWLHPVCTSFSFDQLGSRDKLKEWQANEGAAELLLPYKDFIPRFLRTAIYVEENREPIEEIYHSLSIHYKVNPIVVDYRIRNLEDEILQYFNGVPLEHITLSNANKRLNKNKPLQIHSSFINCLSSQRKFAEVRE